MTLESQAIRRTVESVLSKHKNLTYAVSVHSNYDTFRITIREQFSYVCVELHSGIHYVTGEQIGKPHITFAYRNLGSSRFSTAKFTSVLLRGKSTYLDLQTAGFYSELHHKLTKYMTRLNTFTPPSSEEKLAWSRKHNSLIKLRITKKEKQLVA
jgi:hypothetical protein